MQQPVREYVVLALDFIRRRWWLLLLPVLIATGLAFAAVKLAPKDYATASLILLRSANRPGAQGPGGAIARESALQQVAALEAWLKSDQVLKPLMPRLVGAENVKTADDLFAQLKKVRTNLSLELVGSAALEVRYVAGTADGLGRKLELIVSRLMEGLTGPEQDILNALQFVEVQRKDALNEASAALTRAIRAARLDNVEEVKRRLGRIWDLQHRDELSDLRPRSQSNEGAPALRDRVDEPSMQIDEIVRSISPDRRVVDDLMLPYDVYRRSLNRLDDLDTGDRASAARSANWVGIFDEPEGLLVVGRPQDPIYGESSVKKLAIAAILASVLFGAALALLAELLSGKIRTRSEFEAIAELPVIARFPRLREEWTSARG
jgi:hypothetical protein